MINPNYALSHILCILCEIMQSHKIIILEVKVPYIDNPRSLIKKLVSNEIALEDQVPRYVHYSKNKKNHHSHEF